jgi:hypothetical protein
MDIHFSRVFSYAVHSPCNFIYIFVCLFKTIVTQLCAVVVIVKFKTKLVLRTENIEVIEERVKTTASILQETSQKEKRRRHFPFFIGGFSRFTTGKEFYSILLYVNSYTIAIAFSILD